MKFNLLIHHWTKLSSRHLSCHCCFVHFKRSLICRLDKDGYLMATHPMSPAFHKTLLRMSTDPVVVIVLSSQTCRAENLGLAVDILTYFLFLRRSSLLRRPNFQQSSTQLVSCIFLAIPRTDQHEMHTSSATAWWLLIFSNSTTRYRFSRETWPRVQYQ